MKKLILLFTLTTNFLFAQNEFSVSKENGLTKFVINSVEGKTNKQLYEKTIEWINKTYKNPNEVILAKIENDYIRFEGFTENLFCFTALGLKNCNDVKYQIEVSFKDNKYKFEIISLSDYIKPSQYISGGWRTTSDMSKFGTNCYKNNGEIKTMCKDYVVDVPKYFNNLNTELKNYLSGNTKKEDW